MESNGNDYQAIRYMRHGCGYDLWGKQERKDSNTTQCLKKGNIYEELNLSADGTLQYISLYVKMEKMIIICK